MKSTYRNFITGIKNLWKYKSIIWNDRWWDYVYLLDIIKFKLSDMEKHWGKDTSNINDLDDKKIIQQLINDLDLLIKDDWCKDLEDNHNKKWGDLESINQKNDDNIFSSIKRDKVITDEDKITENNEWNEILKKQKEEKELVKNRFFDTFKNNYEKFWD